MKNTQTLIKFYSKKYDISEDKLINMINDLTSQKHAFQNLEINWEYPAMGDTQRSCKMLDAMFHIEHKKGIILFLQFKEDMR